MVKMKQSFKTVNGMEAYVTDGLIYDYQWARGFDSFKTVNGMEACVTSEIGFNGKRIFDVKFQNRKRYGGMRDSKRLLKDDGSVEFV